MKIEAKVFALHDAGVSKQVIAKAIESEINQVARMLAKSKGEEVKLISAREKHDALTARMRELRGEGSTNAEISRKVGKAYSTVVHHVGKMPRSMQRVIAQCAGEKRKVNGRRKALLTATAKRKSTLRLLGAEV